MKRTKHKRSSAPIFILKLIFIFIRRTKSTYAKLLHYKRLWHIFFTILQTPCLFSIASTACFLFFLMSFPFLKPGILSVLNLFNLLVK